MTAPAPFAVGDRVEARTGPVAHGGHVVARVRPPVVEPVETRDVVVFVRHALPAELVVVEITEVSKSFLRGDAVEVLEASPDRVSAPCPLAHPGGCGGCDFQHVVLPAQRRLKADVIAEQLRRLAGLEREVVVEAVEPTLRWRTRMQYVGLPGGAVGLRKHRSHDVIEVEDCLIAAPDARITVVEEGAGQGGRAASSRAIGRDPAAVIESVLGHDFRVAADGFWQVHPDAPRVLVEAVLELLGPRPGERALDLYAGVGLFSVFLAEAVGRTGGVISVESDRRASDLAGENLSAYPQAATRAGRVDQVLHQGIGSARAIDLVVLDPPREGAKRKVVDAIAALRPRAVAYVACDPAALARDVAYFRDAGYDLAELRAFDLFPMTHHVECVALLVPTAD
ncbi:MAG: class I SAM-dependent RNA methyltransferase [Propionibacteriales bacterium]|nr:class I SAM-dependent RNA methyltransferase [Propionibacteriales bacterium]